MIRNISKQFIIVVIGFSFFIEHPNAGQLSDALGMYFADSNGKCKTSKVFGKEIEDTKIENVCVPSSVMMQAILSQGEIDMDIVTLGFAELNDTEMFKGLLVEIRRKRLPAKFSYEVEVDDHNDDIFKLVDGSVLQKTDSGYVGYIGYHEDAILYKDGDQWKLCVDDSIHKVDLLKDDGYHHSRSSISKSIKEIAKLDVCS